MLLEEAVTEVVVVRKRLSVLNGLCDVLSSPLHQACKCQEPAHSEISVTSMFWVE